MNLRRYVFEKKISWFDLSKRLNVSYPYIWLLRKGKASASLRLMNRIKRLTGGVIDTREKIMDSWEVSD